MFRIWFIESRNSNDFLVFVPNSFQEFRLRSCHKRKHTGLLINQGFSWLAARKSALTSPRSSKLSELVRQVSSWPSSVCQAIEPRTPHGPQHQRISAGGYLLCSKITKNIRCREQSLLLSKFHSSLESSYLSHLPLQTNSVIRLDGCLNCHSPASDRLTKQPFAGAPSVLE